MKLNKKQIKKIKNSGVEVDDKYIYKGFIITKKNPEELLDGRKMNFYIPVSFEDKETLSKFSSIIEGIDFLRYNSNKDKIKYFKNKVEKLTVKNSSLFKESTFLEDESESLIEYNSQLELYKTINHQLLNKYRWSV